MVEGLADAANGGHRNPAGTDLYTVADPPSAALPDRPGTGLRTGDGAGHHRGPGRASQQHSALRLAGGRDIGQ